MWYIKGNLMNMTKRLIVCAAWMAAALGACGQDPVVWWDFDAGLNTVNKGTGAPSYNPSFNGNVSFEAGIGGQGIRFPGSNDSTRHNAAVNYNYGTSGSISLWFKPARYFDHNTLFDNTYVSSHWRLRIHANSELQFNSWWQNIVYKLTDIRRETDTWFHVVFTWDNVIEDGGNPANHTRLYINGSLCVDQGYTDFPQDGSTTYFGGVHTAGEGLMDEVKIYDVVLSSEAIHAEWLAVTGADLAPAIHLPLQGDTANIGTGGAQYDGVANGNLVYTAGPDGAPGQAIMMAGGTADYVAVPYVMPRSGTVSMWYRAVPWHGWYGDFTIVDCGLNTDNYRLCLAYYGTPSLQCRVEKGQWNWPWAAAPFEWDSVAEPWRHVTGTWDASTGVVSMYVNGQWTGSNNHGLPFPVPGQSVYLGGANTSYDMAQFDAADFRIYETCLPASRVRELYDEVSGSNSRMLAYLPFEGGKAKDVVGGNPVAVVGPAQFVSGKVGQGMEYTADTLPGSGGSAYIAISNVLGSTSGSIALWYYAKGAPSYARQPITDNAEGSNTDAWEIWLENQFINARCTTTREWNFSNNGATGDEWYHIVATWNRDTKSTTLYVNGVRAQDTARDDWRDPGTTLFLGGYRSANSASHGKWDEVRVYNYVLAPYEVTALYNNTDIYVAPPPAGTIIILQ